MRSIPRNVLILGAGYAGVRAALDLSSAVERGARLDITLVDRNNHHTLITLLHEVATDDLPPEAARLPLDLLLEARPVRLLQAAVERIDTAASEVTTRRGTLTYDLLVVGLGSEPNFHGIPGLAEYASTVQTLDGAVQTRDRIAAACGGDPCTVLIGGGGYTGVEVAGDLAEWLPDFAHERSTVCILEIASRLLPTFPSDLAEKVARRLEGKGVRIRFRTGVTGATERSVELTTGQTMPYSALVWTGGVCGPRILRGSGLPVTKAGRVIVDRYLRVPGLTNVYAVGDAAAIRDPISGHVVAPSAQLAIQEGRTVARSIVARLTGDAPWEFAPRRLGEIVSVGRHEAVADVGPLLIGGRTAATMKEFALQRYLSSIGGLRVLQEFDRRRDAGFQRAG